MGIVTAAEAVVSEGPQVSSYFFGLFTFVALGALLVVTMMLKVDN